MTKEFLSALAIALTFIALIPYILSIQQGDTKPHVFSWIIWGLTTFIVFFAQLAGHGGVGAWPTGISGLITLYIAFLAHRHKKADSQITQSDWLFFILALSALPFWYVTNNPLWAVIILTTVDLLGFAPTFRKSYHYPFEEQLTMYLIISLRNLISIFALEHYSTTTILFPAAIGIASIIFVAMVLYRRYSVN